MDEIRKALLEQVTVPVWPTAGKAYGLSRNSTYAAVKSGEIPSLRIGKRILVPTAPVRRRLGLEGPEAA